MVNIEHNVHVATSLPTICLYVTGTFPFESRFPVTPVPAKETTYICMVFEFPVDQEYHIVATEAIVDNRQVMHHTLVFGCEDSTYSPGWFVLNSFSKVF